MKSAAWSGGGAAAGAAAGSLLGPGGAIAGAAIGGGAGHLVGEDASLRTGELQGSGAADLEAKRWRDRALQAEGAGASVSSAFDAFKKLVRELVTAAAVVGTGWFIYRNRANIADLGLVKGLWHGFVGGVRKAG